VIALATTLGRPATRPRRTARRSTLKMAVGAVLTGATVIPAWAGFAEPVRRGAVVTVWIKTIGSVFICGALIAVANWVYTLCSLRWSQAGLPMMPPIAVKPGGGTLPIGPGAQAQTSSGTTTGQPGTARASYLNDLYKDC
jgi:hypothetical protein